MTYIPPGVETTARDAAVVRNGANGANGSNGANGVGGVNGVNGRRRREVLQAVISQQLLVSARQLEVMSEQLNLLRGGAGKNGGAEGR
jgi:hypothetical protein